MPDNAPLAVVLGCSGERLTASERDFFAAADPVGFILFRRNCSSPDQVRDLVGSLRGCVGRMEAREPLIRCVRDTAMSVLADPRFDNRRVQLPELSSLDIEISILSPLRPAATPLDFDLLNDGIYLMLNGRSGVFLPQVARETGWRRDQLLDRLCTEKMGFPAGSWRFPGAQLFVFTTKILGPMPFL